MIKEFFDEFLTVFGDVTVSDAVMVALAVVFMVACYKKVSKFFVAQAKTETEKAAAEEKAKEERDKKLDEVITEVKKYPQYRQQSIKIQGQLTESIEKIDERLHDIAVTVDENEVKRLRGEILSFGNSLRRNERHTYEDFQYIIEVHDDYEKLLRRLERKNGVVNETFAYIMSVYRELLDKGTFSERRNDI